MPAQAAAQAHCPLCGGPNACVPAACGHFDSPCWCRDVVFSPVVLARVPASQRGVACVCAACAGVDTAVVSGRVVPRFRPFEDAAVGQAFQAFPAIVRSKLLALRELVFDTAARTPGVGRLDETLKWGEPAYVTAQSGSGSTVRVGWKRARPTQYAMYFHCQTNLVETFGTLFPGEFRFEGRRAIVFELSDTVPADSLSFCIAAALTHHLQRRTASARTGRS
jgi:hypothetical protein